MLEHRPVPPGFLLSKPQYFFALGFGAGLSPYAPGTVGAAMGVAMYWAIAHLPLAWQLGLLTALFLVGCYFCETTGLALGTRDHRAIVWDEIWGMAAVLAIIPSARLNWVSAFVLFRFFDIVKPWPINYLDRQVQGGFGVMLDDLIAAAYTVFVLIAVDRIVS